MTWCTDVKKLHTKFARDSGHVTSGENTGCHPYFRIRWPASSTIRGAAREKLNKQHSFFDYPAFLFLKLSMKIVVNSFLIIPLPTTLNLKIYSTLNPDWWLFTPTSFPWRLAVFLRLCAGREHSTNLAPEHKLSSYNKNDQFSWNNMPRKCMTTKS